MPDRRDGRLSLVSGWTIVDLCAQLTSDDTLEAAFDWLCRRRLNYSANADVWTLRRCWPQEKQIIKDAIAAGDYCFETSISHNIQTRPSSAGSTGGLIFWVIISRATRMACRLSGSPPSQSRSSKRNCSGFMSRRGAPRPRRGQDARAEPNHQHPTQSHHESTTTSAAGWPGRAGD